METLEKYFEMVWTRSTHGG